MYAIGSSARRGFASVDFTEVGRTPIYDDEFSLDHHAGFGALPVLAVASVAGSLIHSSAAGPNRDAAEQVLPLAQGGNLTAIAAFLTRAGIHTVSSAAPWQAGVQELQASHPEWVAAAQSLVSWSRFGAIPPQNVLGAVSGGNAVYFKNPAAQAGVPGSPNQPGATGYTRPLESGVASVIFSPVGIAAALALYFAFGRKR